nr:MAG TPA: hypothetical protein [Caudoviricetes sp.]
MLCCRALILSCAASYLTVLSIAKVVPNVNTFCEDF